MKKLRRRDDMYYWIRRAVTPTALERFVDWIRNKRIVDRISEEFRKDPILMVFSCLGVYVVVRMIVLAWIIWNYEFVKF